MTNSARIYTVVLAAGASTRMKTRKSKLLHELLGKTIAKRAEEQARAFSGEDPIFVVGHQKEQIQESLSGSAIHFVTQDPPRGTGDAVRVAMESAKVDFKDEDLVFIMNGDSVFLKPESLTRMKQVHEKSSALLTIATTSLLDAKAYGRIVRNPSGGIEKIVEYKDASAEEKEIDEINAGFYLIQVGALKKFLSKMTTNNQAAEFYLTDVVSFLRSEEKLVMNFHLDDFTESLGVNNQEELFDAKKLLQNRINRHWMLQGVCFDDPISTWVDESVELSANVQIGVGAILKGDTSLAEGVEVGAYSIIENSKVESGTKIEAFCHLEDSKVGAGCKLGPYARIRPNTQLDEKVKIGNFVETKKSHFKTGSKANHLSYVGDAEVGANTNIGAGTITCNYDGFSKFKTVLEEGVFIGSNSSLVAPVKIGKGAIIGAGSVITKDVDADAIGVVRAEQRSLPGAAKKFRDKRKG